MFGINEPQHLYKINCIYLWEKWLLCILQVSKVFAESKGIAISLNIWCK